MSDDPDFIPIYPDACAIVGGTKPISAATYYRGVKAGRYPAPEHPSPGISRIRRSKLIAAVNASERRGCALTNAGGAHG